MRRRKTPIQQGQQQQWLTVLLLLFITSSSLSSAWIHNSPYHQRYATSNHRFTSKLYVEETNNNIVLRPSSDDDEAFDSYTIGTARVHRYIRDGGLSSSSSGGSSSTLGDGNSNDAQYVMWYHGRSKNFDPKLPPLSTGNIGRAISNNGLIWKKDNSSSSSSSSSQDTTTTTPKGVALGLNQESWWGFDTAHVGLGQVMLPMATPAVIAEGGVYLMYFMGGNQEETPVSAYINNVDDSMTATIKGMNLKIGVAISQDGMTWGRVEGDDPTGACMVPYDSKDPNMMKVMKSSSRLEEELYCGWPEVVVNVDAMDEDDEEEEDALQTVIRSLKGGVGGAGNDDDDEDLEGKAFPFLMYYSTMTRDKKEKCIGFAVSKDGFRWIKKGICLHHKIG